MGKEVRGTSTLDLLGDECSQTILRTAYGEKLSAATLSEACDASLATVYRRIDRLVDQGLLAEETEVTPDGTHRRMYRTTFDRIGIEIDNGDFNVVLRIGDQTADQFAPVRHGARKEE